MIVIASHNMRQLNIQLAVVTGDSLQMMSGVREKGLAVPPQCGKLPGRWQSCGVPVPHELRALGGCCCHGSQGRSGCIDSRVLSNT